MYAHFAGGADLAGALIFDVESLAAAHHAYPQLFRACRALLAADPNARSRMHEHMRASAPEPGAPPTETFARCVGLRCVGQGHHPWRERLLFVYAESATWLQLTAQCASMGQSGCLSDTHEVFTFRKPSSSPSAWGPRVRVRMRSCPHSHRHLLPVSLLAPCRYVYEQLRLGGNVRELLSLPFLFHADLLAYLTAHPQLRWCSEAKAAAWPRCAIF